MKVYMGGSWVEPITLVDGLVRNISMRGASLPATVWVNPLGSDAVSVWYSKDSGAKWVLWENGAVVAGDPESKKELGFFSGVTHIRFQRTAGTGITSTCGVC